MKNLFEFVKKEIVFVIAFILAVVSLIIVRPGLSAINGFLDYKTLSLLFCLMFIVKGSEACHVFEYLAAVLLKKINSLRALVMVLTFLCFFTSMFITNDVALITFVPFSIYLLIQTGQKKSIIFTVVLQTIAANLGSMLLPIGNPQNLYLYSISGMGFMEFVRAMLPVWLFSFLLVVIAIIPVKKEKLSAKLESEKPDKKSFIFLILFILSMCTVIGVLPYYVLLPIVVVIGLLSARDIFKKVDYVLLLTFVAFFVFIGDMKQIEVFTNLMSRLVSGRELLVSVISSQVISNVPAAILLSAFSNDYTGLLWGCDIGGLGTLIASLASLISYKLYAASEDAKTGKYMAVFTGMNLLYLACLLVFAFVVF